MAFYRLLSIFRESGLKPIKLFLEYVILILKDANGIWDLLEQHIQQIRSIMRVTLEFYSASEWGTIIALDSAILSVKPKRYVFMHAVTFRM
jgi:hypothetical protein